VMNVHDSQRPCIVDQHARILVTGSNGFIGTRVVETLLASGFRRVRCLVRSRQNRAERLFEIIGRFPAAQVEVVEGNLKSRGDCASIAAGTEIAFHLAAGIEKSYAGCFLNSVVTTRNLLDAVRDAGALKRFVNVGSLAVYSNFDLKRHALLDETCSTERDHGARFEPYVYAKLKQDELVAEYGATHGVPYVIVRPGAVYGPGKPEMSGRIGIDTFGVFLHLGGGNRIPFTHVDNCASAIVLAGLTPGAEGQTFNIIDDDLPTSRQFLSAYRRNVKRLRYIPMPYTAFYGLCRLWESYSRWSDGQLPPVFNRRRCAAYWKGNRYSNDKLKRLLGWSPTVSTADGMRQYLAYLRDRQQAAC
jgi:nucleoside-diphosphate-sugar epimerase